MNLRPHPTHALLASLAAFVCIPFTAPAQQIVTPGVLTHNLLPAAVSWGEVAHAAAPDSSGGSVPRPPLLLVGRESRLDAAGPGAKAVREADKRFQSGKFCLQEGRKEEARQEFDAAIDLLLDVPADAADRQVAEQKADDLMRLIHRYDLESLDSGVSEGPVFVQSPLPAMLDLTFPVDPSMKDKVLAQISASSSQLPLIVNDAVLSYVNYFSSERGRKVLYAGLKRSGRYKAMITRILDEEGVPRELIHLAQAESAFMPRAVSRAAATGMWQFVRSRGKEYGLKADRISDERLDPEKATRAAARHLHDLYKQMGDWYLAMAAYNCGPYCVERAVQRTGYADYWELRSRSALPRETMNYVPAILGMAIVAKNLQAYGLAPVEPDQALEYDTIQVTAATGVPLIADAADVPVSEIRDLNPSLLRNVAPAGDDVRVPRSKGSMVLAALESVPAAKRASWRLHRVSDGDTLASIARRYSTAPKSIVAANAQAGERFFDSLNDGDVLLIPAAAAAKPAVRTTRPHSSAARARSTRGRQGTTRVKAVSTRRGARR